MKINIDFTKGNGLVPTIIQDYKTGTIYMLGYMNKEALAKTIASKRVYFWSRSKRRIWMKGETSKNTLDVIEIYKDCDADALLVKVKRNGTAVCHTGNVSCFYTTL